ncbi:hypothetical protein JCM19232_1472 [Vibrio ishigakensis]|uniref:Uncharacterized protein n=1 Tax=Vibrio ishigakensis TaxID=1481914 RepID=A0A0B8P926_9VIBR|nr:hypothetical protein JCM19232_1472 [Vibrio ishigakensis]
MTKGTDVKPRDVRDVIECRFTEPFNAHGKTQQDITEVERWNHIKKLTRLLEAVKQKLSPYSGEEIWSSSFWVEDILSAVPSGANKSSIRIISQLHCFQLWHF